MGKQSASRSVRRLAVAALLAVTATGCSNVEPFVFNPQAFNRNAAEFGRTPKDLTGVDICYARYGTTAGAVSSLAADACGRYGKRAVPYAQDILQCPVLTPVRARYHCVSP